MTVGDEHNPVEGERNLPAGPADPDPVRSGPGDARSSSDWPPAAWAPTWQPAPPAVTGQGYWAGGQTGYGPGGRPTRLAGLLAVVAVALLAFAGGITFDRVAFGGADQGAASANGTSAGSLKDFGLYLDALKLVQTRYVNRSSVADQQLVYGSIRGLIDALGDTSHSVFLTPEQFKAEQQDISGSLVGIGVYVGGSDGAPVVSKVIPDSPAAKGGVRAGDRVVTVDGSPTSQMTRDQFIQKVRGPQGSKVTLGVIHSGATSPVSISLTRTQIKVAAVGWSMVPGTTIADVAIAEFSAGVSDQLATSLRAAQAAHATAIVLDLRGNPGGLVSEVVNVTSQFLTQGTIYLKQDASGNRTPVSVNKKLPHVNLPIVVLVDHYSASGAEIVTGALQDNSRARVVGTKTFGTGTVLQTFQLSDGSAVVLGVEDWLTPKGHRIFGNGIQPDETVDLPSAGQPIPPDTLRSMTAGELQTSKDSQLLAALKLLASG